MGKLKLPHQKIIGFALESDAIIDHAKKKLVEKNCDIIVANNVSSVGSDQIQACLITSDGVEELNQMSKDAFAQCLLIRVINK